MNLKIRIFLVFAINSVASQEYLFCLYGYINNTYTCSININNPNEDFEFTHINGTHLPGFGDDDILAVTTGYSVSTKYIPAIICNTFHNVETLSYRAMGLTTIHNEVFDGCPKVTSLDLSGNKIEDIAEDVFKSQENLKELMLNNNQIVNLNPKWFENLESLEMLKLGFNKVEEVPLNTFGGLTNLQNLWMEHNKLEIVHSFGQLGKLGVVNFINNQIIAIDEKILDQTSVNMLIMTGNICSDTFVLDNAIGRPTMRATFRDCFDKYEELFPTCVIGNLDERVCSLEVDHHELLSKIESLSTENEELSRKFEDKVSAFTAAIEDLQNQINELKNPPTATEDPTTFTTTFEIGSPTSMDED